jgi:tetratricopeptide (TPR) repeat protein
MMGLSISISKKEGHWLLPVFFLTYVVATAIFFVNGRLRLPVMPIMIVYSSYAIIVLLRAVRIPAVLRTLLVPILISAAVSVALLLFQPSVTQNFAPEYLRVGEVAFSDGNYIEAESAFRASLEEKSTADGMTNLGNALAAQERSKEAAELYRAALQEDSTSALAWFNFGNLWMQTGKPQYAYGYWKKALQYQPRLAGARRNLGLLLLQAGRLPEAEEQLRQYLSLERDPQKRAEIQRDLSRMRSQRSLTP